MPADCNDESAAVVVAAEAGVPDDEARVPDDESAIRALETREQLEHAAVEWMRRAQYLEGQVGRLERALEKVRAVRSAVVRHLRYWWNRAEHWKEEATRSGDADVLRPSEVPLKRGPAKR